MIKKRKKRKKKEKKEKEKKKKKNDQEIGHERSLLHLRRLKSPHHGK